MFRPRQRSTFGLTLVLALVVGCSGEDGPPRYTLSGAVTYDGQPVAAGWIIFTPAAGPGASANIENGHYETPPGFGTIGGPHTIEIAGFDGGSATPGAASSGSFGKPLFRHTMQREIPSQATSLDFAISSEDLKR